MTAERLSDERRGANMRAVKARDTAPERLVRSLVHRMGFRYRLHVRGLPGTPDLVFRPKRKVIFVHGCFWHGHDCPRARRPASNVDFWNVKLDRNIARDLEQAEALQRDGWSVLTIWECEMKDRQRLTDRLRAFLDGSRSTRI